MVRSRHNTNTSVRLPLIEAVIIIAIFAAVSTAIMQLYVAADRLQGRAVSISRATICAENTAELIRAAADKNDAVRLAGLVSGGDYGTYICGYDEEWNAVSEEPEYIMKVSFVEEAGSSGVLLGADILITDNDGYELMQINTAAYKR